MKINRRGFTLIEILVTVTVIALLTMVGVVSYSATNKRSRDSKRKSDIEQMRQALEMYRADNGSYPAPAVGWNELTQLSTYLVDKGYLTAIPADPIPTVPLQKYYYQPTNQMAGLYYGYCLSANLESENPSDTCTPYTGQNYASKNP